MKYAFLVAWREYAESTKAKGFWVGIFLIPAILFFSIQAPIWLEQKATPVRYFVTVDQSGSLGPVIQSDMDKSYQTRVFHALEDYARKNLVALTAKGEPNSGPTDQPLPRNFEEFARTGGQEKFLKTLEPRLKPGAPPFQPPRRAYQAVQLPPEVRADSDLPSLIENLKPYLRGEKKVAVAGEHVDLAAAVLIPRDIQAHIVRPGGSNIRAEASPIATAVSDARPSTLNPSAVQFWSVNASDPTLRDEIERIINSDVRQREYVARGLDARIIHQVEQTSVPFTSLNPKKEKGKESVSAVDTIRQWAPSAFVYLLWLSIFMIVQMLLTNTIEEKSNRIIEVLLSSVTPGELMIGKLFGIAAIGLTMIGTWMLALFGILSWKAGGSSVLAGQMLTVLKGSNLIFLFSLYFMMGYLMYAGFILALGSVCNTLKEAQSYMSVLTMIMMVPLLTMTFIPKDPNGSLARVLSWIPLYTPFTMMNRASADPPTIDLVGTFVLLMVCTVGAMWMAGKIFRIGILRTGQPPKIIEMLRWVVRRAP